MRSDLSDLPPTLTVTEAASLLQIPEAPIRDAMESGQLPALTVDTEIVVPTARLLSMLDVSADALADPQAEAA
jgi:hypothetical protein